MLITISFSPGQSRVGKEASPRTLTRRPEAPFGRDAIQMFGTSLPSWLTVSSAGGFVRGLASRAESNSFVGSLNLHDWCFLLARQTPSLWYTVVRRGRGERE